MRHLSSVLVVSVLLSAPSCGRTNLDAVVANEGGTIAGGGVRGAGGTSAAGGAVGTGGASSGSHADASTTRCNWPSCMTGVGEDCLPAGGCIQQGSYSTGSANICYANGVKEIIGIDTLFNASATIKNATMTCFTMRGSLLPLINGSGVVTMSLLNEAGNVIGSVAEDLTTNHLTITCTGSPPVTLDPSCITGLSPSNACTSGTCLP